MKIFIFPLLGLLFVSCETTSSESGKTSIINPVSKIDTLKENSVLRDLILEPKCNHQEKEVESDVFEGSYYRDTPFGSMKMNVRVLVDPKNGFLKLSDHGWLYISGGGVTKSMFTKVTSEYMISENNIYVPDFGNIYLNKNDQVVAKKTDGKDEIILRFKQSLNTANDELIYSVFCDYSK